MSAVADTAGHAGAEPAVGDAALRGLLGDMVVQAQREGRLLALQETARAVGAIQETLGNMNELGNSQISIDTKNVIKAQETALKAVAGWIQSTIEETEESA